MKPRARLEAQGDRRNVSREFTDDEHGRARAKRYVYGIVATMLDNDLGDREGWLFGGIDSKDDRTIILHATKLVIDEMSRKRRAKT